MAFSTRVKLEVRRKSHFRCCICHAEFVEVHHIIPLSEGGENTLNNAAPLCASCHDLFGGNPEKRNQIKEMRDHWWGLVSQAEKNALLTNNFSKLLFQNDSSYRKRMKSSGVAIYHVIRSHEKFDESAQILFNLIQETQKKFPDKHRGLFLDIEGHKGKLGSYDSNMFELQRYFIMEFLSNFLSEVHIPLIAYKTKSQSNDIPDSLKIFKNKKNASRFMKNQSNANLIQMK